MASAPAMAAEEMRASEAGALSLASQTVEETLGNGLKVLLSEDHKAPLAIFMIWYRVGSMDEPAGRSGLSHLLEHMMFKGTSKHGPKELSRTVNRNGGVDNAFTSRDLTAYFQLLPVGRIGLSLDFESDRMKNLVLQDGEIASELKVVMEERRWRYEDDPQNSLYEQTQAAAFPVHPYRWPVIGWMSDLGNITPADLKEHYARYYTPDNAVIVVAGDIDPKALMKDIRKSFGRIANNKDARRELKYVEPPQRGLRRITLRREAELPYFVALHKTPTYAEPDSFALDVLSEILSGGKSSRLYRSLVYEKKSALDVSASYMGMSRGSFTFEVSATAAAGTDIYELEKDVFAEIAAIAKDGPTEAEMQKARNRIEADYIFDLDSIYMKAMLIGMAEVTVGGWRSIDRYVGDIHNVTAEDVKRVAAKYLSEDERTIGTLIPANASTAGEESSVVEGDK